MTDQQKKFLELAKELETLVEKSIEVRTQLDSVMAELGMGAMFQDPETSTVYRICKPKGRYVHYSDIDYNRTAQGDEKSGSLSKKDAEAAGFILKKGNT